MSGHDTVDLSDYYHPGEMRTSRSAGGDVADRNSGNIVRVVVDAGKTWYWAAIAAISCTLTVVMFFSTKQSIAEIKIESMAREEETQSQLRVYKNHADSAWQNAELCIKDVDKLRVDYALRRN